MASLAVRSGGALRRRILLCSAKAAVRSVASLAGATPAITRSSTLLQESRVATIPLVPSANSSSLRDEAQVGTATPVLLRGATYIADGIYGSSAFRMIETTQLGPITSIRGIKRTTTPMHPQTYAGAATSFRRPMSSAASPSGGSPGKEVRHLSDPDKAEVSHPGKAEDSHPGRAEACKFNEHMVLSQLDKIRDGVDTVCTKVDGVSTEVHEIRKIMYKTIDDCNELSKEVALLKKKEEGSGDWTAVKIKGKNLNWLTVGSAAWELFKGIFK